ncbi:MAG: HAD family hydrolase [Alphaproteobacteria bacterium]|nr:HAD family hydrolase [Alphaproteobacteria bacterium]
MPDSTTRLVIFDCDGVLVDSEAIACRVDARILTSLGFPHGFDDMRDRYVGIPTAAMCADIEARFGRPLPPDIAQRLLDAVLAAFEDELEPIPGIAAALDAIDLPRCVASSSSPPRIRRSLEIAGLLNRLEPHLFSATMVARGKPAPDIFLHAASAMGVDPRGCAVVEDSVPGVLAARAAGMRVLGFVGGGHCGPGHAARLAAAGAELAFDDMTDLPRLLAAQGGTRA